MDVAEFEQDILKLAFETDVRITTASVAYYLGIPSTKASPMLEELLERGVLELDSDPEGNLYYRVADAALDDSDEISRLRQERLTGVDGGTGMQKLPDKSDSDGLDVDDPTVGGATVEDLDGAPPLSPRMEQTPDEGTNTEETEGASEKHRRNLGVESSGRGSSRQESGLTGSVSTEERGDKRSRQEFRADESVSSNDASQQSRRKATQTKTRSDLPDRSTAHPGVVSESEELFAGLTREQGARDASLDTCGNERVVVQSEAECEPRPLADSSPVLASCSDRETNRSTGQSNGLVQQPNNYSAVDQLRESQSANPGGSAAASLAHRRQNHLEKPEHQPGMSLLLSLILCGTGQIYNGEVSKGIMMMVLCFLLWFVLLGWVVHIWSIVDSVVVAERINRQSGNN